MKNLRLYLAASLAVNVFVITIFAYKLYNNWFEMGVLKAPFRESIFNAAPKESSKIYFIGDSHTEAFELNELLQNSDVRNRGIWGDVSGNVLKRMDTILAQHPKKIFLMIGVNDVCAGNSNQNTIANFKAIIEKIQHKLPNANVYVESVLPTNQKILHSNDNTTERIKALNIEYKAICEKNGLVYVDLFPYFVRDNVLKQEYSFDGLHLNGSGYVRLAALLKPFVDNQIRETTIASDVAQ